jgi:hypothetical protein
LHAIGDEALGLGAGAGKLPLYEKLVSTHDV